MNEYKNKKLYFVFIGAFLFILTFAALYSTLAKRSGYGYGEDDHYGFSDYNRLLCMEYVSTGRYNGETIYSDGKKYQTR